MIDNRQPEVAEFQGFYGPFTVTERLLQKIWLQGDFYSADAKTADGKPIEILFPGKWNLLEGPDFKMARLRIGGEEITGDIEIHFRSEDWQKHGHHLDKNYNNVVLHVLLFPPAKEEKPAILLNGKRPPALSLLELLHHDLEEYAAEEVIKATLALTHWQATEALLSMPLEKRRETLLEHAEKRWKQKVHFARIRLEKLGWLEACHQSALEIFGYRRNRGPMLTVATRFPLRKWEQNPPSEEKLLETAHWQLRGSRPANHPRRRLRQYLQLVENESDWPEKLRKILGSSISRELKTAEPGTRKSRSKGKLGRLRKELKNELLRGFVRGTRLDTLVCDGFLPLAAAEKEKERYFPAWFSWYAGDFPDRVNETLRTASITDHAIYISCNGFCQGVLGLSLEKINDPLVCFESPQTET